MIRYLKRSPEGGRFFDKTPRQEIRNERRISCLRRFGDSLHLIDKLGQKSQLIGVEPLELFDDLGQAVGVAGFQVEEFLRCDLEVVTNAKENGHGGKIMTVLDITDIAFALSERQTHITGGYVCVNTKLCQSLVKLFVNKQNITSLYIIVLSRK